jgi:hypothetical protein
VGLGKKIGTHNDPASVWVAAKSWWDVLMKYPIQQNSVDVSSCGTGYLMPCQSVSRKGLILFVKDFYYLLRGKIARRITLVIQQCLDTVLLGLNMKSRD